MVEVKVSFGVKKVFDEESFMKFVREVGEMVWPYVWRKLRSGIRGNWEKLFPYIIKRVFVSRKRGEITIKFADGTYEKMPLDDLPKAINEEILKLKAKVFDWVAVLLAKGHPVSRDPSDLENMASEVLKKLKFPMELVAYYIIATLKDRGQLKSLKTKIEDTRDKVLRIFAVARIFEKHPTEIEDELNMGGIAVNEERLVGFVPPENSGIPVVGVSVIPRDNGEVIVKENPKIELRVVDEYDRIEKYVVEYKGEIYYFKKRFVESIVEELGEPKKTYIIAGGDGEGLLVLEYKLGKFLIVAEPEYA